MPNHHNHKFSKRTLNDQERSKLHHEVSQIVNHRFLLTTIAVTVFAISSGWIVPQFKDIKAIDDANTITALSLILTFIMLLLYWQSHYLRTVLRTFTSYLIVVDNSQWEKDWKAFRAYHDRDAHNDTKSQILAYVFFCVLSGLYPMALTFLQFKQIGAFEGAAFTWGILVAAGIVLHTHRYEEYCEKRFIMEWENALAEADKHKP